MILNAETEFSLLGAVNHKSITKTHHEKKYRNPLFRDHDQELVVCNEPSLFVVIVIIVEPFFSLEGHFGEEDARVGPSPLPNSQASNAQEMEVGTFQLFKFRSPISP